MRYKIASISHILRLPVICDLCNQYHSGSMAICEACVSLFTHLGPACQYCALPLPAETIPICGKCCKKKPYLDRVITAYQFKEPLRSVLHDFKYQEGLHLLSTITTLMLNALPTNSYKPECLIAVPMHPKRIRLRGFNQAAELTKRLGRELNIPFDLSSCKKIINTAPQASLDAIRRRKNLYNAFEVNTNYKQHVTLIDDLMTTGSTANEIARILKKQGVARVDLWCCARVGVMTPTDY